MVEDMKLTLPITGMDCANCAAAVERNIKKVPGIDSVNVNYSTEKAVFVANADSNPLNEVINRIQKAGYDVAIGETEVLIDSLDSDQDAKALESALRSSIGITDILVNWVSGKVRVKFIPTLISIVEIRKIVQRAGFDAEIIEESGHD